MDCAGSDAGRARRGRHGLCGGGCELEGSAVRGEPVIGALFDGSDKLALDRF